MRVFLSSLAALAVFAICSLGFWLGGTDWFFVRDGEATITFFTSVGFACLGYSAANQALGYK